MAPARLFHSPAESPALPSSRRLRPRAVLAILAGLALLAPPALAAAQGGPLRVATDEPKYTAIVMDARTGEVLYANRADHPRYPASVTKVMTMYLAFEQMAAGKLHESDTIVVSPHAAAQSPTKLGLRAGETISVENALHAMAVISANDMAVAMAEKIGGTESHFAQMMTAKAQQLGMMNTQFVNANGLPDTRQISTARDLAILSRAVLQNYPQYYGYFSQQEFTYHGRTTRNHNALLGRMPGLDGLKTGFTSAAGFNLAASAVRNGNRLIAVVMGGSSGPWRNANVENLLLTGFDIEQRRAQGERLAATQSYFENAPQPTLASYTARSAPEDGDPIDAVLTRSTARPAMMPVTTAMPAPPAARPTREARNWWVQIGKFKSRGQARTQVEDVSRRFARLFDDAEGSVASDGRLYRARFSGFSEDGARQVCATVRSAQIPCVAGGGA